ncbi:phage terminase large subunit [Occultella kanbiaonis]|uniref:phage terminase large subunit n=1 Tax=Occultella kanbiaonis TaxID=2675754 RepID=UPI0013D55010|nr:phage terminase large subunit [Occultella kanbiaonis]
MSLAWAEHAARSFEPAPPPRWATPGQLAAHLDPKTRQTGALDLIDAALVEAFTTPDARVIISMPPQEGKSQRASRRFPLWALTQNKDLRVAIASYEAGVARRWGRAIRDDVTHHATELGLRVRDDLSAQHEWQLASHDGGVYTAGVGGALTGRAVDLLIIDDPIKDRAQADSEVFRDRAWDWWTDTASTRLAPGAPVILILTRWHHDDLAGRLLAAEDGHLWTVVNIPAEADHRPERGQVDPLGREPGQFMDSARGRTTAQWEAIKIRSGPRTWASLYQGHPTPDAGDLFPETWATYDQALWVERADGSRWIPGTGFELVQSWDFTFKDKKSSDYVVGQVWLRIGVDAYLVDQVRARLSFTASLAAIKAMTAKWPQAVAKFVEDKANGPAIINALQRQIPGLIPIEPEGSKYARASAVSPFVHSNNVHLPTVELLPNVGELLEEARAFPSGAHDDTIDAMSQALNRILLMPLLEEDQIDGEDLFEDVDDPRTYLGTY